MDINDTIQLMSPTRSPAGPTTVLGGTSADSGAEQRGGEIRFDAIVSDYNALPTFPVRPSYKEFHSSLSLSTCCVVYDGCQYDSHKPGACNEKLYYEAFHMAVA
jgi:hypothetical protein